MTDSFFGYSLKDWRDLVLFLENHTQYYKARMVRDVIIEATEAEKLRDTLSETVITLAARNGEIEQLRKERDEYKQKYELTRAGCVNTDIKDN